MKKIDLHVHSTASDGKTSPADLVRLAKAKGLAAIAITDHDSVGGISEAVETAKNLSVEIVPGIEVSTAYQGQDFHILGYYLEYNDKELAGELARLQDTRNRRNRMMIAKLNELGFEISYAEVASKQKNKEGNIGRPHIAEVLLDKQIVSSKEEAFAKFLGKEGLAYVNPPRISPEEGIHLIQKYKGIPVLAHPGLYQADQLIDQFVRFGLKGIEVYHPDHSAEDKVRYLNIAKKQGLIVTGGSDYHGEREGDVFHADLGSQEVPWEALVQLKEVKMG